MVFIFLVINSLKDEAFQLGQWFAKVENIMAFKFVKLK